MAVQGVKREVEISVFILPIYSVTIWTQHVSSTEIILPNNILGCSGFVLSTLSIFTAT